MSKFMMWLKKSWIVATIAGVALAAVPVASVFANGLGATTAPATNQASVDRLQVVWARELVRYQRIGDLFAKADQRIAKAQTLIDKAKANGKDVTALQTALDNFSAAVAQAKTIYDSAQSLVSAHAGFDSAGKVTDATQAKATIKSLRDIFKQIRQTVQGPRQALVQAVKAFRQANGK